MESSSSDSEVEVLNLLAAAASAVTTFDDTGTISKKYRGGSVPGRAPNREFNVRIKSDQLDKDVFCRYHCGSPLFTEKEFERTFRMPRDLYEEVRIGLLQYDKFWKCNRDTTGKAGASTDLKLFTAFQMLCDDRNAFSLTKEVRQSEAQNMKCMKLFCAHVVDMYEGEWLIRPNEMELSTFESRYRQLGFPGCIGAVDCASWYWENYPVAWKGIFTGKEGTPCCRMEVICDDKLRIWSLNFGIPGSKNDRTIMSHSSMFNDVRNRMWPPVLPEFDLEGYVLRNYYYLADGIYSKYLLFALPHPDPRTKKEKRYGAHHSSARK